MINWFKNIFKKIKESKILKVLSIIFSAIGVILTTVFVIVLKKDSKWLNNFKKEKEFDKKVKVSKEKSTDIKNKTNKSKEKTEQVNKEIDSKVAKIDDIIKDNEDFMNKFIKKD